MESVSAGWIKLQEQKLLSQMYIQITFDITDPDSYSTSDFTTNGSLYFSDYILMLTDTPYTPAKIGTLEKNLFLLDGSYSVLGTETNLRNGYISSMTANSNGLFTTNPIMTITFGQTNLTGINSITLSWGENVLEFAKEFKVYADGEEILHIEDNTNITNIIDVNIDSFKDIEIEVIKWSLPYHRVRISNVYLGIVLSITKKDLINYEESKSIDPILADFPSTSLTFSINNTNGQFNPNAENNYFQYLSTRQQIKVKYGFKVNGAKEYIKSGTYFLSNWSVKQNDLYATFEAKDILSFLTSEYYHGHEYPDGTITLYDLMSEVLQEIVDEKLIPTAFTGTENFIIDASLKNYTTSAPLPICTYKQAIQYIAQAGGCTIDINRDGLISIVPARISGLTIQDYKISKFNTYSYSELELESIIKTLKVNVYQYHYEVNDEGSFKTEILFDGKILVSELDSGQTYKTLNITYASMGKFISSSASNGSVTIVTTYANSATIQVTPNTLGTYVNFTIKGYKIISSNIVEDFNNTAVNSGVEQIIQNPLITNSESAENIIDLVWAYLISRRVYTSEMRIDPRLDCLDVVQIEDRYGNYENEFISSIKMTYEGAMHGTVVGKVVDIV